MSKSKFAGIFEKPPVAEPDAPQRIEAAPVTMQSAPPVAAPAPPPMPQTSRPIGRPHGKRSDPAWKQYTVLLKRETQRDAMLALRAEADGKTRDLSDLLQDLLAQWVSKRAGQGR